MTILQSIYAYTLVLLTYNTFNATTTILTPTKPIKMAISEQDHLRLEKSLEQINRLFLATQSSELPLFIELRQQILAYNKRYKKCSELEGWEFPVHAIKVLSIGESLAASHPEEEIDVSNFTNAVLQWRVEMSKFFRTTQTNYAKVRINIKDFQQELSLYQSTLPLVSLLYKEWQGVLSKQGEELLGEELFGVLQTHKGAVWEMTSDLGALQIHYKKYKRAYKKHSSDMESFQRSAMPKAQYFLDALLVSSSKEDPNLPANKEELAAELQRWEQDYKNWLNESLTKLSNIDSTEEGKVINKHLLSSLRRSELIAPAYAQTFWESTGAAIEAAIVREAGAVSYKKAVKIAIKVLEEQYQQYVTAEFLQAAVASRSAMLPLGLEDWLRACVDNNELLYDKFLSKWQAWCESSSNIVALCEHNMKGKTYTVDNQKLSKAMTKAFSYTVNGTSPGVEIWEQLKKHLPVEPRMSFEQLHQAWQNGVEQLGVATFTRNLWNQHLTSGQANENLEQAIAAFFSKAPSQELLVNALWDARYQAVKAATPTQNKPLLAAFQVKRNNGEQGFHFFVQIPLVYKEARNQSGKLCHHALPSAQSAAYYLEVADSLSYEIDKTSLRVERHTTEYLVNEEAFTAKTGVTFYLSVRDTLSRRVVEQGGVGKYNLLTLDADLLSILTPKLQGMGANTDFLKQGLTIELLGDEKGELESVKTEVTLFGFPVELHYYPHKEWPYNTKLSSKSLLAYRKARMLEGYGSQRYDLKFYAEVYSSRFSSGYQEVSVMNGRIGSVTADGRGEVGGREDLEVNFIGGEAHKIILKNKE